MNRRGQLILSFILCLVLMFSTSAWIARGIYRLSDLQMDMDEAVHANRGLEMAADVRNGDLGALWADFSKPEWYPPGHGVLSAAWLSLLGPGIETARLYSTFFYLLFGLLLWWSACELLPEANPFLYLLPPLFLIADALYTVHAGLAMLELPAMTCAFGGLLFLNRAWRRGSLVDQLLALVFGTLCLFTKYNYGLVVFGVFAVSHLFIARECMAKRAESQGDYRQLRYLLVFWGLAALIFGLWFLGLGQWRWLLSYAGAQPEGYSLWSRANLSYYPRRLWKASLNWLGIALSIGGIVQMVRKRRYVWALTPYILFFGFSLVMLTLELQNNPRFAMMLFPALWMAAVLGAYLLIVAVRPAWLRGAIYGMLIAGMLIAGVSNFYTFQSRLYAAYENANDGVDQAYRFIADVLDISQQTNLQMVMLGRTDQWNGQALHFHLEAACLRGGKRCAIDVQDSRTLHKGWPEREYPEDIQKQRIQKALDVADYRVHFFTQPEHPEGWTLIGEREFTFERLNKKPKVIWVSIYRP